MLRDETAERNRSAILRAVTCTFLAMLVIFGATSVHAQVQWKSGAPDESARNVDVGSGEKITALLVDTDRRHVVLRFERALTESEKTNLAQKGVRLLSPLGNNAYFALVVQGQTDALGAVAEIGRASCRERV